MSRSKAEPGMMFPLRWMQRRAAGITRTGKRFCADQHGIAMTEFAIVLPVLLTLFYGCIEVTRYAVAVQKVEKLTNAVADMTTQTLSADLTQANLNSMLSATNDVMRPYDFASSGTVIISSLYRPAGAGSVASVNWRHQGGGTLAGQTSRLGALGAVPTMPAGFTFDEKENVIAAEVFFRFSPLVTSDFFSTLIIYRQAFYRPRLGELTAAPT